MEILLVLLVTSVAAQASYEPQIPVSLSGEKIRQTRMVNGSIAWTGQYPYFVSVFHSTSVNLTGLCGGSIIAKRWILTAAHCADDKASFMILVGNAVLHRGNKFITQEKYIHPEYNPKNLQNDIALLHLSSDIIYTDYAKQISLPNIGESSSFVGYNPIVMGFGKTSDTSDLSVNLRYAEVNVISNSNCIPTFGPETVVDSTMCTVGLAGQSICNSDSGGPVVYNNVQIGIISFIHATGCKQGKPFGNVRITSHRQWINNITGI
ncbi:collagenase-like [Uranotaenia lowii]|uniref:collagenase-like n=1 Tax=Uranotaenia lowii TaxID=190385 RepID=UPI00247AADCB|nr:collagenase-like [Uranotaenia lowii]